MTMIGKPVALIQVPNRRLFSVAAAAQYLGKAIGTIRKLADLNIIRARVELDTAGRRRRVFALEDLNAYVDSLEPWYESPHGKEPGSRKEEMDGHL